MFGGLLLARAPIFGADAPAAARPDAESLVKRALEAADKAARPGAKPGEAFLAYTMLEKAAAAAPNNMEVMRRLADLNVKTERMEAARDLFQRLVREFPKESPLAVRLARCQIATGRLRGAMDTLNGVIRRHPGFEDAYAELAQLYRDRLDDADRAGVVIDEMVAANPKSARAYVRRGEYWKRAAMPERAKADFARALELAPDDLDALLGAAEVALDETDFAAARQFLARAEKRAPADRDVRRMRLKEKMVSGKTDEALAILREMGGGESEDPSDLLTLIDLLLQEGDLDGVREALRRMRKADFREEIVQFVEARLRAAEGKWREAADILERIRAKVTGWPEFSTHVELALAACYVELKLPDRAAEVFRKLLEKDRKLLAGRVGLASLLLRSGKVEAGLDQYRRLERDVGRKELCKETRLREDLRQLLVARTIRPAESQSDNMRWARRTLAAMLADGTYREQETAIGLLDENAGGGPPSVEDLRPKAAILAGRTMRKSRLAAIEVLQQIRRRESELRPAEQSLLAHLYDQTGQWASCREEMQRLLKRYPEERRYLAAHIGMLLKHEAPPDEIAALHERLEELPLESSVTFVLGAQLLVRQGKPRQAVRLLERLIPRAPLADRPQARRQVARLLEDLEQYEAAERLLREFADEVPGGSLVVAAFLGRRGRVDEALDACEAAQKDVPAAAIVPTVISVLTAQRQKITPEQFARAEKWIQAAIEQAPRSKVLQLQLAGLRDLQGKADEQIKIYRDFLARSDVPEREKAIVHNNLAYLLALKGEDLEQALEMVNQAIDAIGPVPELLDTRAVVYLAAGDPQKAMADLREAIADTPAALHCFHLALAHRAAGERAAAVRALQVARDNHGLTAQQIPRAERKRYDELVKALQGQAGQSP